MQQKINDNIFKDSGAIIRLIGVSKSFGANEVVHNIDLEVKRGEFLTLLGPSGCGKTTTLRMIAGFEETSAGDIFVDGVNMNGVPPYNRPVNTVFQNYALFPLMNVYDNIAYGLTIKKLSKAEIRKNVTEALKTVQLDGYEKRRIKQLSGGQKQRVAIARALVNNPKVLLLDEPLGALDFKLRKQMQLELKYMQRQLGITFIYVTHDQEEALTMSDRIAIINNGAVEQIDTPDAIYSAPGSRFVADFIGESNILEAFVKRRIGDKCLYETPFGELEALDKGFSEGQRVYICIRPESIHACAERTDSCFAMGKVTDTIFTGNLIKTMVDCGGRLLTFTQLTGETVFKTGSDVWLACEKENCVVMEK